MNHNENKSFLNQAFRVGTPECAVFSAGVAMLLGLLFLWVGFWKTLFIFCLMLVGAFIGGVGNKRDWLRDLINRLFPAKPAFTYREPRHGASRSARRTNQEPEETPPPEEYPNGEEQE